jgi:AAA+ superfamily predicted ATPase
MRGCAEAHATRKIRWKTCAECPSDPHFGMMRGMARSDLLQTLVASGISGDSGRFRRTVEAIIAEERAKRHHVFADQLTQVLRAERQPENGAGLLSPARVDDLLYEQVPKRRLVDLILAHEVREACQELIEEHRRVDLLRSHNLEPRNRILLIGPPGNGKTSLADAIACELGIPLLVMRYEGVIGSFLGETAQRLRRVFDFVRVRPCVLFLDEFDTLGKERGDEHETGEIKRVVSSLLLQVDALPPFIVLVTATNHPELLDRAVWRRFQLRLELPTPTRKQIEEWAGTLEHRFGFTFSYSARRLADALHGSSYAELEQFALDVARQRALAMPEPNELEIVRGVLKRWRAQLKVRA